MNRWEAIRLALIMVVPSFVIYWLPTGYDVRQSLEITGKIGELSRLPTLVETTMDQQVKCQLAGTGLELECASQGLRRRNANAISRTLNEKLTGELGWVFPEELSNRIAEIERRTEEHRSEASQLQAQLTELDPSLRKLGRGSDKLKKQVEQVEKDLANQKRRLELIDEGSRNSSDPKVKALYETKRTEVEQNISELAPKLAKAEAAYQEYSKPLLERDTKRTQLDELSQQMMTNLKNLERWRQMVHRTKPTVRLPDPESFQLSTKGPSSRPIPRRGFGHIPWALLIGPLLFSYLYRGASLSISKPKPPKAFQSAEEFTKMTGLPVFAVLPPAKSPPRPSP